LTGGAKLLDTLAVYLWLTGLQLHHPYAAAAARRPASSIVYRNMVSDFMSTYDRRAGNPGPAAGGARADRASWTPLLAR
jgi:hypothetical protein